MGKMTFKKIIGKTKAHILFICKGNHGKTVKEITRYLFDGGLDLSSSHVCDVCSDMEIKGFLRKSEINHGKHVGRSTYYITTELGVLKLMEYSMEQQREKAHEEQLHFQKTTSSKIATLKTYLS